MQTINANKLRGLAVLLGCLFLASPPSEAQIAARDIRVGIGLNENHPQGLAVTKFADLVRERSGGKISVTLHANGKLGNDVTMIGDLQRGKLEMAVPDTATLVSQIKGFGILNFPFLFNTEAEADVLLDGPFGKKLLASLEEKDLIGLGFWENGFRNVTNNVRRISRTEDLRGLRMRVMQNPMFMETFSKLGSTPVPLPFPEVYAALESRKIDAQENPLATIQSAKFYNVQKYLTLTRHTYSVWVLLMSKQLWSQLSAEERKIISQAALEARDFERQTIRSNNALILEDLRKSGMDIGDLSSIERSKLRMATRPIIEKYKKEFGKEWSQAMYLGMMDNELKKIHAK